jgi:hypothetical protein
LLYSLVVGALSLIWNIGVDYPFNEGIYPGFGNIYM